MRLDARISGGGRSRHCWISGRSKLLPTSRLPVFLSKFHIKAGGCFCIQTHREVVCEVTPPPGFWDAAVLAAANCSA